MNVDGLDVEVLYILMDGRKHTSTGLVKKIFVPKSVRELRGLDTKLRYRLKKWVDCGVVGCKNGGGKNRYFLRADNIIFGEGILHVKQKKKQGELIVPLGNVFVLVEQDRYHVLGFKGKG